MQTPPPLSNDERYLAHLIFENRLLKANGDAFQGLFWGVMSGVHGQDFVRVRPQGALGDGGNDGWLPTTGHYFQVHGPVDPQEKLSVAIAKLEEDFKKVKTNWGKTGTFSAYSFVYNDKCMGLYKEIAQALKSLEDKNNKVKCRPFMTAELEDQFLSLNRDKMVGILGCPIPDSKTVVKVQFSVLKEVIEHILSSPVASVPTRFGELPGLDEKIQLNNLSKVCSDFICIGARQAGHVDSYFSKNTTFIRQHLRDHMVEQYRLSRESVAKKRNSRIGLSDSVFFDFRQQLVPKHATIPVQNAVDILIGYYFEACDVFDPHAAKGAPNASPR